MGRPRGPQKSKRAEVDKATWQNYLNNWPAHGAWLPGLSRKPSGILHKAFNRFLKGLVKAFKRSFKGLLKVFKNPFKGL